jgi:hypothetical protein
MHRRAGSLKVVRPIWNAELTSRQGEEAAGHPPEVWGSANRGPAGPALSQTAPGISAGSQQ